MGLSQSNGFVNVTGTVTALESDPNVLKAISGAGTGTQTLGTVPAGKQWIIKGAQLSSRVAVDSSTATTLSYLAAGTTKLIYLAFVPSNSVPGFMSDNITIGDKQELIIPAGTTVTMVSGSYLSSAGVVYYVEEVV